MQETDSSIPIFTDYTGTSLILDHSDTGRNTALLPEVPHYVMLLTWNVENNKMVFGWYEGLREYAPIPDLSDAVEVYRSGKAVILSNGIDK